MQTQFIHGNTLREMLKKADKEGYAVPSFNYSDIWDFLAIAEAAAEEEAPVMIASHQMVVEEIGVGLTGAWAYAAMEKASTPLIHHLDHSTSVEICKQAIQNRYPSVMIDASAETLEENIERTKAVVEFARASEMLPHVEAEIGRIKGRGYEGGYGGQDFLVQVEDAKALVQATGIDSLAIGIGTAHGFYEGRPEINFTRLEEVNKAVETPLVLHGGTGIPAEDVQKAISLGINKINVGTIIHCTYMNNLCEELKKAGSNPYTLDIMRLVRPKIKEVVKGWIRTCGANGKA